MGYRMFSTELVEAATPGGSHLQRDGTQRDGLDG